jgi:large subunit ribosomal protein L30
MEKTIAVKWVRSSIGRTKDQKRTIRSLGFKRLHQTLALPDRLEIRGMIQRVIHLLEVLQEQHPSIPASKKKGRAAGHVKE